MKLIFETVDNGIIVTQQFDGEEKSERSVIEHDSRDTDQKFARRVLWEVMEKLGYVFSKHGDRLQINIINHEGEVIED